MNIKKLLKLFLGLILVGGITYLVVKSIKQPVINEHPKDVHIHEVSFADLPGWQDADVRVSFDAFKNSCAVFLKQDPERLVGSQFITMRAKQWYPACRAAQEIQKPTLENVHDFFQKWFKPFRFCNSQFIKGLFTGYYSPMYKGSLVKTSYYSVPLYGLPKQLITANLEHFDKSLQHKKIVGRVVGQKLVPFYTRKQIDEGALDGVAPVIAWVHSPLDRLTLGIEGSGTIQLTDGSKLMLGYAGENGAKYTAIAKVLIDQGIFNYHNASMQKIKAYLNKHPEKMYHVLHKNESFVFFTVLKKTEALGAQGIALTAGHSMAVDRHWVPMGAPLWLNTTAPGIHGNKQQELKRLMIAQDTGGAIRGPVRGDFYWGSSEDAGSYAGKMKNHGYYWLLLPKEYA